MATVLTFHWILVLLSIMAVGGQSPLAWQVISTTTAPQARRGAAMGYDPLSKQLVLFGGEDTNGEALGDTWILSIDSVTGALSDWMQIATTTPTATTGAPSPRWGCVSGMHTTGFVVAMGQNQNHQYYNDVWLFSLVSNSWSLLKANSNSSPDARAYSGGGLFSARSSLLYVTHGKSHDTLLSDTVAFDIETNTWKTLFTEQSQYSVGRPHARYRHGAAMLGPNKLMIFGGCLSGFGSGGPCPSKDVWITNDEDDWDREDSCPLPRVNPMLTLYDEEFLVMYGGESLTAQAIAMQPESGASVWSFHINDRKWTHRVLPDPVPERREAAAITQGGQGFICMFGGYIGDLGLQDELWCLSGKITDTPSEYGCEFSLITPIVHGVLMFTAWGVFFQGGGIIARFFKLSGNWWIRTHKLLQVWGTVLAVIGFGFGVAAASDHFSSAHGGIGLFLMIALGIQVLSSVVAKQISKHNDKDEKGWLLTICGGIHRWNGRVLMILSIIDIVLGIFLIVAPTLVWSYTVILMSVLVFSFLALEYRLRRIVKQVEEVAPAVGSAEFQRSGRRRSSDPWSKQAEREYVGPATRRSSRDTTTTV